MLLSVGFLLFHLLLLPAASLALAAQAAASATRSTTTRSSIVTGANGFVGRALVHELLTQSSQGQEEQNLIVCLVRPHRVKEEKAYWNEVTKKHDDDDDDDDETATCDVQVLPYDMLDGGTTLRAALDRCSSSIGDDDDDARICLYHVASVFGPTENHKETALENVKGTCDVLETVHQWSTDNNKPPSACKIILTSSMAAVRGTGQEPINGKFYTAKDWNTVSVLGANWGASYQWSKKESEHQAQVLAQKYQIPLVTLCPSFVFGPPQGESSSSFSIQLVRQWAKGESPVQSRLLVDIRDVALAHVRAGQRLDTGRFILSTEARVPSRTLADWIRQVTAPSYREAIHSDDDFAGGAIPIGEKEVDAEEPLEKALGIKLRSIQETIQDMTVRLVEQEAETSGTR